MKKLEEKKKKLASKMTAYHPDKKKGESYIPYVHPDTVAYMKKNKQGIYKK